MNNILVVNSSVSGADSVSRILVDYVIHQLKSSAATIVNRDLGAHPVPHLSIDTLPGIRGVPRTAAELAARSLSDELIAELRRADTVVIGAPMYNFSIPTTLRSWFDYVVRADETFSYSAAGPRGLVTGKRAIVVESRGGLYSEGPGKAIDFQEPYLRQLLSFIGITDVTFVRAEKVGYGPEARIEAIANALTEIRKLTPTTLAALPD